MRQQRFLEILQDVRRVSWADVLLLAKKNFQKEHPGEEAEAFFECEFYCNWRYKVPKTDIGPQGIVSCLEALSDEAVFCLYAITITPVFVCGEEKIPLQAFRFNGNVAPRWHQLHLRVDGKDTVIHRDALVAGTAVTETPSGAIFAFVVDDYSVMLISADGGISPILSENNQSYLKCFPGVKAMIAYDNADVENQREYKACHYYGNQHLSAACRASFTLSHNGEGTDWTQEIRDLYCYIDRPDKDGPYWQLPCIWGFEEGKMVLGSTCPDVKAEFIALVPEGETYSVPVNDKGSWWEYGDSYNEATLSIRWDSVETELEVVDGVLKSVPDRKELIVPAEALSIDHMALRFAPSLEKIIIHAGVTAFSYAIADFVETHRRKLDVVFEGSLQEWFTRANALSGKIGSLLVDGKEQDFYSAAQLVVPEGINSIGSSFFKDNDTLETVVLGPEVTVIENGAFSRCKKLRSVKVMGPAVIGESAFSGCHALEEVYLADGVTELADGVFDWVTAMESVYIPASVQKVGRISHQNDGSCVAPTFLCEAASKPDGWYKEWNLSYYDPRFGLGHGHDHYHSVKWDCKRK